MNAALRFAAKACMLYAARPEFVVPFEMSRTQRYQFGDAKSRKDSMFRIMFPDKKVIRPKPEGYHANQTGRTMPYHIRGWTLRTLRHERYSRNPDGTLKVVLVAPMEINPELKSISA